MPKEKKKIAIFHHFLKGDCKGGGEKLILQMREHYGADLWVGGVDLEAWGKHLVDEDDFAKQTWDPRFRFEYLHKESKLPIWKHVKRQLFFLFSPKVKKLKEYDIVIFSYGNVAFVPGRVGAKPKKIVYCHTPPRAFADQYKELLKSKSKLLYPFIKMFKKWITWQYQRDMSQMDYIISNSENIKGRLKKHMNIDADQAIFPAVDTNRFKHKGQKDYYLSYARLENLKRIKMIVGAFAKMPDKKLVVCSGGPLASWVEKEIKERRLKNITFEGRVSDQRLEELVGNCIAGVYIPIDEDAGITQCEIMSAGKPVIGVKDGGLIETIIDKKTGILLPKNITEKDLIEGVRWMSKDKAKKMRKDCEKRAAEFDQKEFFKKFDKVLKQI